MPVTKISCDISIQDIPIKGFVFNLSSTETDALKDYPLTTPEQKVSFVDAVVDALAKSRKGGWITAKKRNGRHLGPVEICRRQISTQGRNYLRELNALRIVDPKAYRGELLIQKAGEMLEGDQGPEAKAEMESVLARFNIVIPD